MSGYIHRYEDFAFTPEERTNLKPVDPYNLGDADLHGYLHETLDRSAGSLNRDFWSLDSKGIIHTFKEIYAREGRIAVLDAGCGTGYGLWGVVNSAQPRIEWDNVAADAVSNQDFSRLSKYCRPRAAIMAGDINYVLGDLTKMELPESAYDLVYSYEVLPHIEKPQSVITSLWRALSPRGVLYFNARGEQVDDVAQATEIIKEEGGEVLSMVSTPSGYTALFAKSFDQPSPTRRAYKITKP